MRQKKRVPKKRQPTWEEWVSPGETVANKSTYDPVDLAGTRADHPGLTHEAIANLAYSYWEAKGCQGGSAEEDWLRAEADTAARIRGLSLPDRILTVESAMENGSGYKLYRAH